VIRSAPVRVTARPYTFPVATGGWNAVDALDAMKPDEAETLVNWFPETTFNRLRRGYAEFCDTGTGEPVTALAAYSAVTDKLLAFSLDTWFDVTTGTASSLATGFSGDPWDWTNFGTAGGHYLIAVDGSSLPQIYDGATMVNAANTIGGGAPGFEFSRVAVYNSRVYYARVTSARIYYLPVGQYQGALTEYDLGPLLTKGGTITKIATWTRDNASAGANEMFLVVSDQGEVLVFIGDYPGGTWQLSARFDVGLPVVGPNSVVRLGPDCVLLCEDGFQPMAHYLQLGQSQASAVALSKNIGNAVTQAMKAYRLEAGWSGTLYPAGNMLIFNIPQSEGVFVQFVVNTLTGAWCKWTGQNAWSWVLHEAAPYFGGGDGVVYLADYGGNDAGDNITAEYRGSYQYLGSPGLVKRVSMAQPIFQTSGVVTVNFGIDVDFNNTTLTSPNTSSVGGGVWGSAVWGLGVWGSGLTQQSRWVSVTGIGYAMAPHFLVTTNDIQLNLMSINLVTERGAFL
jgi:hypothetical protein